MKLSNHYTMPKADNKMDIDRRFMAAAIRIAQRHVGQTNENPSVGAIIVQTNGNGDSIIVGHGVTEKKGRPHAEPQALAMAGELAHGATVYVTLEPCSHYGKTPPCADQLVKAGVARVVIALRDPDERVSGKGIAILQEAGIAVECGVMAQEAFETLSAYLCIKRFKRPEVTLKMAVSTDHAIGKAGQGIFKISNEISHYRSHILRFENDVILVGVNTVMSDNPSLTCRLPGLEMRSPIRAVLDPRLRIPLQSKLVCSATEVPLWVICGTDIDDKKMQTLLSLGVVVIKTAINKHGMIISDILDLFFQRKMNSILIEGGANTAKSFLKSDCVDRVEIFHGAVAIGDDRIDTPDFNHFLQDFIKIESADYGSDHFIEWRHKTSCLLV